MFQDILNQASLSNALSKNPQQQQIFGNPLEISIDQDVSSNYDQCKNMHIHNLNKESTEQLNSFVSKEEKSRKEKKKRIRKYTSNNPNNKKGHWTKEQCLKYHYFLELNARYFIDSERRKIDKVFKSMSNFIQTRQPHQCRSHHQKIQNKWGSFPNILLNLRQQNFNITKNECVIRELQKIGYKGHEIFQQCELQNQQQLYRRIISQQKCENGCGQNIRLEQNNQQIDNLLSHHKPNCMCLMMSERYEDQLLI